MQFRPTIPPRTRSRGHGGAEAAFTLIELVVVVAMLGILIAMVVPIYGGSMTSMRIRNTQSDFVSLIEYIQERAVTDGREYRLYIDKPEGLYWVMYIVGRDGEEKDFEPETREYGRERYLPEGLIVERIKAKKDRKRNANYVACYPNGACDVATIVLAEGANRRRHVTIKTTGVMGKLEVERAGERR